MSCGRSRFPDPRAAPSDGPLAVGTALDPDSLVDAYRHGVFPWPEGDSDPTVWWWSPNPRAVFPGPDVRISRSLRRTLRQGHFSITADRAFAAVVAACADRPGQGTWITPELAAAYVALHQQGVAHSLEVWDPAGDLVGGVYGVAVGAAFCGESMFHRATDASKVALVALCERLRARGFWFLDAQLPTPHLASLGAVTVPRSHFLDALDAAVAEPVRW